MLFRSKEDKEALAALRKEVREAVNKCDDQGALQAALDIMTGSADFDYNSETQH